MCQSLSPGAALPSPLHSSPLRLMHHTPPQAARLTLTKGTGKGEGVGEVIKLEDVGTPKTYTRFECLDNINVVTETICLHIQ